MLKISKCALFWFTLGSTGIVGCGQSEPAPQGNSESKNTTGPQGPQGPQGPAGVAGVNGEAGRAGESFHDATRKLFEIIQPKRASVLDLTCGTSNGTGTRISADTVITAFHVIEGASSCVVRSNGLQVAVGGTMSRSPSGRDIGYVRNLNFGVTVPVVQLKRNALPKIGDMLVLLSHPSDLRSDLQVSLGFVTDENAQASLATMGNEWQDAIISDMSAGPGSSGGPIFNFAGEFVGIHVGGFGSDSGGVELNFQLVFRADD